MTPKTKKAKDKEMKERIKKREAYARKVNEDNIYKTEHKGNKKAVFKRGPLEDPSFTIPEEGLAAVGTSTPGKEPSNNRQRRRSQSATPDANVRIETSLLNLIVGTAFDTPEDGKMYYFVPFLLQKPRYS